MINITHVLEAVAALLAIVSTRYFYKESALARGTDAIGVEMEAMGQLLILYNTNLREFWIRSAMQSFEQSRAKTVEMAKGLSDEQIREGADKYKPFYEEKAEASLTRWRDKTVPAILRRRRKWQTYGFISGALSVLILFYIAANGAFTMG